MTNDNVPNPNKEKWQPRGFGWVPDLPDVRDLMLESLGNLKDTLRKEGETESIDKLTSTFREILTILTNSPNGLLEGSGENLKALLEAIEELDDERSNGLTFPSVRIYKILRADIESKEVIQLKYALHLVGSKYQNSGKFNPKNIISSASKNESRYNNTDHHFSPEYFDWLRSPIFDELTQEVIEAFQEFAKLEKDGIAGLETLLALQLHLESSPSSTVGNSTSQVPEETDSANLMPVESWKKRAEFISIPSLIPQAIFPAIFESLKELRSAALGSRAHSRKSKTSSSHARVRNETEALRNRLKNRSAHVKQTIAINFQSIEFRDPFSSNLKNESLIDLVTVFNNEFLIVEPIISVVLQSIGPLAKYDNLESALQGGVETLKQLLYPQEEQRENKAVEDLKNLTDQAFQKVRELLEWEYKFGCLVYLQESKFNEFLEKLEPIQQSEDQSKWMKLYFDTLHFYALLEEIVGVSKVSSDNPEKSNLFSKKELFQVQLNKSECTDNLQDKSASIDSSQDFPDLSSAQLKLPVSYNLKHLANPLKTHDVANSNCNNRYLFLPGVVDLSYWCSPVEDQGSLNACTAFAGVGLLEYFAQRNLGDYINLSPMFLYKTARNLMQRYGDTGASVRQTMKAMVLFGLPPEKYWPYNANLLDEEPPAFCYSYAQNYQSLKYFRLDSTGLEKDVFLFRIKATLAAGIPCMFGFTMYSSALKEENIQAGYIPFPGEVNAMPARTLDKVCGGHAVVAIGYSDYKEIRYANGSGKSQGALLIRNSWGTGWGSRGYGWLPYDYVLNGITADWWALLKTEWFDTDYFGLGVIDPGTDVDSRDNPPQNTKP